MCWSCRGSIFQHRKTWQTKLRGVHIGQWRKVVWFRNLKTWVLTLMCQWEFSYLCRCELIASLYEILPLGAIMKKKWKHDFLVLFCRLCEMWTNPHKRSLKSLNSLYFFDKSSGTPACSEPVQHSICTDWSLCVLQISPPAPRYCPTSLNH